MANEANRPNDGRTSQSDRTEITENNETIERAHDYADVVSASPSTPESAEERSEEASELVSDREVPLDASSDQVVGSDPADAIPVPPAMSPAEIDERAQAVEAVRGGKVDPETGVAT